ncbi:enoyl-CoA hydratase/isomerase family protein [Streptomyces sp. NK08204]|uniref:enoyl-CoA hydratase/isomerase family protein n=1 Tax=Streptomyces sp. NK08204 TaxID=2873260 RepID=UPI001CED0D34|nr:enoyl-CoA hydratase/isomerase family protein [Streptomyces sp. NK08204]
MPGPRIRRQTRACPVPGVARVPGHATGGGAKIASSAGLVVARGSAARRFTGTAVGLAVTGGFTAVLPRTAGPMVSTETILPGEPFDAARARTWGLVNRAVPDADLEAQVRRAVALLRTCSAQRPAAGQAAARPGLGRRSAGREAPRDRGRCRGGASEDAREAAASCEGRLPRFARS